MYLGATAPNSAPTHKRLEPLHKCAPPPSYDVTLTHKSPDPHPKKTRKLKTQTHTHLDTNTMDPMMLHWGIMLAIGAVVAGGVAVASIFFPPAGPGPDYTMNNFGKMANDNDTTTTPPENSSSAHHKKTDGDATAASAADVSRLNIQRLVKRYTTTTQPPPPPHAHPYHYHTQRSGVSPAHCQLEACSRQQRQAGSPKEEDVTPFSSPPHTHPPSLTHTYSSG